VSKSVAYQKYVHFKACLARRYIYKALGQVKMTFIPVPTGANYTKTNEYQPISLLSFRLKTMQKLMVRNIKGKSLGYDPYIYSNLPTNKGRPQNRYAPREYEYIGSSGKQEVTLELS
jgi:hypothetical protein